MRGVFMSVYMCGGGSIKIYLIKRYRHLLSTNFCFDPFKLPYGCYDIQTELAYKLSVIDLFPSTFGPILGHPKWRCILQKRYNLCKYVSTL